MTVYDENYEKGRQAGLRECLEAVLIAEEEFMAIERFGSIGVGHTHEQKEGARMLANKIRERIRGLE